MRGCDKYVMRKYIDIIASANDNREAQPMDRRETANLALADAAQRLADKEGITLIQARRQLQQEEYMKRNAAKFRKQFWQGKADQD